MTSEHRFFLDMLLHGTEGGQDAESASLAPKNLPTNTSIRGDR
jgi:hypothetical protein